MHQNDLPCDDALQMDFESWQGILKHSIHARDIVTRVCDCTGGTDRFLLGVSAEPYVYADNIENSDDRVITT